MTFDVSDWCRRHLGSPVVETLVTGGHLSQVHGVRLSDGRDVMVKTRPASPRLTACTEVQRALWQSGFPAPQPLVGPIVEGGVAANAEAYVPDGALAPTTDAARRFADLLARFVALAPASDAIGSLTPELPWTAWDHTEPGIWPIADDRDANLNAQEYKTPWLDDTGSRVRRRLARFAETSAAARVVLGHGDWEAQNLRWQGDEPLVVHDWDSVTRAPEAVIVGLAASVWPCGIYPRAASLAESAEFLDHYQRAVDRVWSAEEIEASWAAGLWVYAFNTKKASLDGEEWLPPEEAEERLKLAGA